MNRSERLTKRGLIVYLCRLYFISLNTSRMGVYYKAHNVGNYLVPAFKYRSEIFINMTIDIGIDADLDCISDL